MAQPQPQVQVLQKQPVSLFRTLTSSLFGSPLAPAPETDQGNMVEDIGVEEHEDSDRTADDQLKGVYFSAEDDNVVVEGFMCPLCMIDCGGDIALIEHFETQHPAENHEPPQQPAATQEGNHHR